MSSHQGGQPFGKVNGIDPLAIEVWNKLGSY